MRLTPKSKGLLLGRHDDDGMNMILLKMGGGEAETPWWFHNYKLGVE